MNPSYQKYLQGEHWRTFRRRFFAKFKPRCCTFCYEDKPLCLHHKTYARVGAERFDDVVAICDDCHEAVHDFHKSGQAKNLRRATERVRKQIQAANAAKKTKPRKRKKHPRPLKGSRPQLKGAAREELKRQNYEDYIRNCDAFEYAIFK